MLDNTVEDLIQQVRDLIDEDNTSDLGDDVILRMLNRSQQEMVRILTKKYNSHYMRETIYTSSDFEADSSSQNRIVKLSNQAFGFAVNMVDAKIGTSWFPVPRVPFSYNLAQDNASESNSLPTAYSTQGNDLYFYPKPSSSTQIRVRYQFRPAKLVKTQSRITSSSGAVLTVDSVGSGISTSVDTLAGFINIIDHLTGEIKSTHQVSGYDSTAKTITIKTSGLDRSTVFGYTVSDSLPSTLANDDLVCLADGTCVPTFAHDLTNFLVDIAGFYTKRKLAIVDQADYIEREAIIKAISSLSFGREYTKKIERTNGVGVTSYQHWFRGQ